MKFKCKNPNCDKINKYGDALKHINTCDYQLQACPQGCGMGILGQDLQYHKMECPNTKYMCKECDEEVFPNKPQESVHNCVQTLKKLLAEERQKNQTLQVQIGGVRGARNQQNEAVAADDGSSEAEEVDEEEPYEDDEVQEYEDVEDEAPEHFADDARLSHLLQ